MLITSRTLVDKKRAHHSTELMMSWKIYLLFEAIWMSIISPVIQAPCSTTHYGPSGVVANEGFPAYMPLVDVCAVRILVDERMGIMLSFQMFEVSVIALVTIRGMQFVTYLKFAIQ